VGSADDEENEKTRCTRVYVLLQKQLRKKRREWSLAGDVGLLKHLQQFSEV